jgi:hypothetical protein
VTIRGIPLFVHVQYRCSACGQPGEKLLAYPSQSDFCPASAPDPVSAWPEAGPAEGEPTEDSQGPILLEEVAGFAHAVARFGAADLAYLRWSLQQQH